MISNWAPIKQSVFPLFLTLLLVGCGGGGSNNSANTATSTPTSTPVPGTGGGPINSPNIISLGAGQTASGVNISVPMPSSSPAPNAQVLGVAPQGSGGSAFNTGSIIHRGDVKKVLLFGPGLSGDASVTIAGPTDIAISNVRAISATDGTAGVAFDVAVSGNAALGARAVFIRLANNDITAFAGGLEVLP